jgi:hypothetical protein
MNDIDLHRLADAGCPHHGSSVADLPAATEPTNSLSGQTAAHDCPTQSTRDETVFAVAMDEYKRKHQRPFPTWREVLAVAHALGYRRVADATELPKPTRDQRPSRQKGRMNNLLVWIAALGMGAFLLLDLAANRFGFAPTFSERVEVWGQEYPVLRALYVFGAVVLYFHFWGK